jgi:hypothetical protein
VIDQADGVDLVPAGDLGRGELDADGDDRDRLASETIRTAISEPREGSGPLNAR